MGTVPAVLVDKRYLKNFHKNLFTFSEVPAYITNTNYLHSGYICLIFNLIWDVLIIIPMSFETSLSARYSKVEHTVIGLEMRKTNFELEH